MATINFPSSPTIGQTYTFNSKTWTYNGTGWALTSGSRVANALAGGIASQIPYQTAPDTTAFITNGTAGQVLTSNGTSAPTWNNIAAAGSNTQIQYNSSGNFAGSANFVFDGTNVGMGVTPVASNGILQLGSYGSIQALLEKATITASAPSSTTNFDVVTQAVQYYTTPAANNFTLNIRGNSSTALNTIMQIGQSVTIALLVTNGSTAYYPTSYTIDSGSPITPKWQGGTAPTAGNASSTDIYSITVVKTASATFTMFAVQNKFA